ncbi:MAG: DNA repair protein RecO, partial [Microcystaceae cyanobacterium]
EEPQPDLYSLLNEHLRRIAALTPTDCLHSYLTQAIFHLLALGGFAPSLHYCGITQQAIAVNFDDPRWQMGFSFEQGGLVALSDRTSHRPQDQNSPVIPIQYKVNGIEVTLLQHLSTANLPILSEVLPAIALKSFREGYWVRLERLLRDYAQFHLEKTFRAASLLDSLATLAF